MKNSYGRDVAEHLALLASGGTLITYGELAERFGGVARGWGSALGGIAIWCFEAKLPLLPVIVVNSGSGMPSLDAVLYENLGLKSEEDIRAEQKRVFFNAIGLRRRWQDARLAHKSRVIP